jgi:hypothetical protein
MAFSFVLLFDDGSAAYLVLQATEPSPWHFHRRTPPGRMRTLDGTLWLLPHLSKASRIL